MRRPGGCLYQGARAWGSIKKVVLVTGGGAGIGAASVRRFAREGWRVFIGDLSKEDGIRTRDLVRKAGGEAECGEGDIAQEKSSQAWAAKALELWGRIDALVANAGVRVFGSLLDSTEGDWERIVGVNLKGVAYACKSVLPSMIERKSGSLVIISSANALVGRADMPLYDATKAAVLSLTRSLAVAYGGNGIRANAICPGYTMTDYHERKASKDGVSPGELRKKNEGYGLLGRPCEPDELASAVYFLSSPDAAMITGQTLFVDAGLSVRSGAS